MKFFSASLCFFLVLFIQSALSQDPTIKENAIYPPRGWNSYDSFSWTIVEQEFLENAAALSSLLLDHGYEIAIVDAYWYSNLDSKAESVDQWGRLIPDPERWPSSVNGVGFRDVADQVHRLGLKFGVHLHGGINAMAIYIKHSPILDISTGKPYQEGGREWLAEDIILNTNCPYAPNSFYINTTLGAGKAFLRSVFDLLSSWGVDFVKLDCVFGGSYNLDTIVAVSEILEKLDNPIILSLSPGYGASVEMGKKVSGLVNMYRVTSKIWDRWSDILSSFDPARKFALERMNGAEGLRGNSWFDLDALPFGLLTDQESKKGPYRNTSLTLEEMRTQITLWTMARSPLIFGGDLRSLDLDILNLLINPTLKDIHFYSSKNKMIEPNIGEGLIVWIATGRNETGEVYVAVFNTIEDHRQRNFTTDTKYLGTFFPEKNFTVCKGVEVWQQIRDLPQDRIGATLGLHDCALFALNCTS